MKKKPIHHISGIEDGLRVESRVLEERIQTALRQGHRFLEIEAFGQHGIGGRLWDEKGRPIHVRIKGSSGQRVGSMGYANTSIDVLGPVSDDLGWLNAGCEIVVHGNATNGVANAMAQGRIWVGGNVGARAMTMTKHNPRFAPPELWVLGTVGDYFAEFMAGGTAVICGVNGQDVTNVLGYRPCVGMVGGRIYFRGPHKGFSHADAKLVPIDDESWQWLVENLKIFAEKIDRPEVLENVSRRDDWQLLVARSPFEKTGKRRKSMQDFSRQVWEKELGAGGLIGDLSDLDRGPIGVITTGELRRFVPVWENRKYLSPCEASCPTGMPVQERWRLIREGRIDEAVDMALSYTPFPGTVCGYLCPNLCMQGCTRQGVGMAPVDVSQLGKASVNAKVPEMPPLSGKKVAVIGGGPSGISTAWQLRRHGHEAVIYDMEAILGGKMTSAIPRTRIPGEVVDGELERVREVLSHVHLQQPLTPEDVEQLKGDYDFVVIAVGAQKPRVPPIEGKERMIPALDFLKQSRHDGLKVGKRVVVIGAGNVGCDVATEARRLGAEDITLIDIQEPASFGEERKAAEAAGARFRWPCFTNAVTDEGVELKSGEVIPADTVIVSIGDSPDLAFLPDSVATERGFVVVNAVYQTTDAQIFAIGDAVKPGLLTDAIGAGRRAAEAMDDILRGKRPRADSRQVIDPSRIKLAYFDPRVRQFDGIEACAGECSSCGACRDCGVCVNICPEGAISRETPEKGDFEMVVDPDRCIACGFCVGACPCGVWSFVANEPLDR
jgi:NADPH-dependent glutamate synthase beta subunit-like oxidoreductase/glutamate synthase domain-containing protein 3/NAD-dependent dihydropyrimidine dehydrogenase PreA subunit